MTWFADLTPYVYSGISFPGTLNIGWLERDYEVGPTSETFRTRLRQLCSEKQVNRTAGWHFCCHCTGSAEVHIRAPNGQVYAAPSLVLHYVEVHNYRPPDEFIEAVLHGEVVDPEPEDPHENLARDLLHKCKRRDTTGEARTTSIRHLRLIVNGLNPTSVVEEAAQLLALLEAGATYEALRQTKK